jgi:hypothetical protein
MLLRSASRIRLTSVALIAGLAMLALPAASVGAPKGNQQKGKRAKLKTVRTHGHRAVASRAGVTVRIQSPAAEATVSGTIAWTAAVSGATATRVDFAVDGRSQASDSADPYAYGSGLDTTTLSDGRHTLSVTAYSKRAKLGASSVTVTVSNQPTPPPPPPEPDPEPEETAAAPEEPAPAPTTTPKPSSIYWGAWIGDQLTGSQPPWDMSAVTEFEEMTRKKLSIVHFSSPFANCSSACYNYSFPSGAMTSIRNHGSIPFFSWASQSTPSTRVEPDYELSDVLAGKHDVYIRKFAEAARNWGHPFFMRFNWEMNGGWFPWGAGTNNNQVSESAAVWRHVHDIFTEVGATNATWTWCPNIDPDHRYPSLASFYPGDAYVDWTCLDGYNWGTNPWRPDRWRTFDQLFSSSYHEIVDQIAPSKPMIVGEVGSTEYGGSKAAWISDMLSKIPTSYPKIRGLLYFEKHDSADWPLETSSSAVDAFASGIANSAYAENTFGSLGPAPILPPG